jgi:nicotinamide-nucleotide adenylyltransferase
MNSDYDNCSLVVGRFQPLHKGHMDVISKCAAESEHITIGIGSAQCSHTAENPFTAGERYMMINKSLREAGIDNYSIVPIEDLNRYPIWVAHVVSLVPPFRRVYSNNPLTRRLFEEAGFDVRASPLYNRDIFSGTEIRKRICNDEEWRSLVPKPVAKVIEDIDGVNRIKQISSGSDGFPLRSRIAPRGPEGQGQDHVRSRIVHRRDDRFDHNRHPWRIGRVHGLGGDLFQRCQGEGPRSFA